jgi:hypothetical protein
MAGRFDGYASGLSTKLTCSSFPVVGKSTE